MRLSSLSFLEGFYYKPRIDKEILERHAEGLICLSGCASAEFSDYILHAQADEAERLCAWYQKIFGEENFFVEIQDNGVPIQKECAEGRSISPGEWGCPSWRPATPITSPARTPRRTMSCSASTRARRSTTRPGCGSRPTSSICASPEEMYAAMPETRGGAGHVGADRRDGRAEL